jgi:hypothetical protein
MTDKNPATTKNMDTPYCCTLTVDCPIALRSINIAIMNIPRNINDPSALVIMVDIRINYHYKRIELL